MVKGIYITVIISENRNINYSFSKNKVKYFKKVQNKAGIKFVFTL